MLFGFIPVVDSPHAARVSIQTLLAGPLDMKAHEPDIVQWVSRRTEPFETPFPWSLTKSSSSTSLMTAG